MSDVIATDPFERVRTNFYNQLGLTYGPLTLEQTEQLRRKAEKEAPRIAKAQEKEDSKDLETSKASAKAEIQYEDRRARFEQTLLDLKDYLPASAELVKKFEEAKRKADVTLDGIPKRWEAALEALKTVSVKNALGEAEKAWEKLEKTGKEKADPAYKLMEQIRRDIVTAKINLPDGELSAYEARVQKAERDLLATKLTSKDVQESTKALGTIRQELISAQALPEHYRFECGRAQQAAKDILGELGREDPAGPLATDGDLATLQRSFNDAETLMALREFSGAKSTLDDLVSRATNIRDAMGVQRTAWSNVAGELPKLITQAGNLAKSATSPEVKERATSLATRLEAVRDAKPGKGIAYDNAVSGVRDATGLIGTLLREEQEFVGFLQQREAARDRVAKLLLSVNATFDILHDAVSKATDGAETTIADAPFRARIDKILGEWNQRLTTAHDGGSLDETGAAGLLRTVAEDIRAAAANGMELAGRISGGRIGAAQEAYVKQLETTSGVVQRLLEVHAEKGIEEQAKVEAIEKRVGTKATPGAYQSATTELEGMAKRALEEINKQADIVRLVQLRLDEMLKAIGADVQMLFDVASGMSSETKRKPHLAMQLTLQTSVDTLRGLQRSSQVDLLNNAVDEAEALARDAKAALALAKGEDPPEGAETLTFEKATKRLTNAKDSLKTNDMIQMFMKASAVDLDEKIDEAIKGLGGTTISEMAKEVTQLVNMVTYLETQAQRAKSQFEAFEGRAKEAAKVLEKAPFTQPKSGISLPNAVEPVAPNYSAALKAELKTIIENARFEGGLSTADAELAKWQSKVDVDEMKARGGTDERGMPRELADGEAQTVEASRKKEVAKTKYEAEKKILERDIKALKGTAYPDDIEGLENLLKGADGAAKQQNFEDARDQLQAARDRLMLVSRNPRGLAIHVRNQLPACEKRFREAVAAFNTALGKLGQDIAKTELEQEGKAAAVKALTSVRALFNPAAFAKPVSVMSNQTTEEKQRAAAREMALRDVSRMLAYLNNDYRLQALANTKFEPHDKTMPGLLSELNLALLDLENNALVSM